MQLKKHMVLASMLIATMGCDDSVETSNGILDAPDMGRIIGQDADTSSLLEDDGVILLDAELTPDSGATVSDAETVSCMPNEVDGCIDVRTQRLCDPTGTRFVASVCAEGERCRGGVCEPTACRRGELVCLDGETVGACRRDETGFTAVRYCVEGSPCVEGRCESSCNPAGKVPSNVGCEYWSVDLDNYPDPLSGFPDAVPHVVVISNTSDLPAMVTVEGPEGVALVDPEFTVDANDLHVFTFPRLDVDGTGIFDRSFKINATQPVIAYQFNPFNNEGVASNDASLLLPKEGLGRDYIGLSWPTGAVPCFDPNPDNCLPDQNGYLTVVATSSGNTIVRVTPTVPVAGGGSIPNLPANMEHEFTLAEGEVLNLQAQATDLSNLFMPCTTDDDCGGLMCTFGLCIQPPSTDLTGSLIKATQPIAVFGGHEEAVVKGNGGPGAGQDSPCCAEHLEQQLLPIASWGTHYLAARSEPRGGSDEVWRIVAQADGTVVDTTLNSPDDARFTLNQGEYREIITPESFEVTGSQPIMVAQYLVSQGATRANIGDPALIIVPPTNQLRTTYQTITPSGYSSDWLTIAKPAGVRVSLDGADLAASLFTSFGSGQYEMAWVEVEPGVHYLESDAPFALTVYGFSAAVSYGYPGGLNLDSDMNP